MSLSDIGLDDWFEEHVQAFCEQSQSVARVVAVDRDRLVVHDGSKELSAELLGKFFYGAERATAFPCVGDWVCLELHDTQTESDTQFSSIHTVLPRKTLLKRKASGYDDEFQLLAANIDTALIVMACDYDFHVRKLERFLVLVNEGKVEPVLILTKTDLMHPEDIEDLLFDIEDAGIDIKTIQISNKTGAGVQQVHELIQPTKTYCMVGSSGVGKSSLMNQLLGENTFETQEVSANGEGRHTTVRRHLMLLEQGGMIVDMPGMRELAIAEVSEGIEESFEDILELALSCRFSNCGHSNEPGCAIIAAIENDELDIDHYDNYLKIQKESTHHKTTYAKERRKGKNASRLAESKTRNKKQRLTEAELKAAKLKK
ncbi:MAG: ribosome small subunit-dependent GTPase A [Ghiorsea sp.]|nr:ribosome small subunit-dependent GTPase A [Ghiorsea sp.]